MTPECSPATVTIVVDQVEDVTASVELPSRRIVEIPLGLLPASVREGDTVALCVVAPALPTSPAREARLRVTDGRSFSPSAKENR